MTTCLDAPSHADPSWLASSRGGGSNVGRGKGLVDGLSLGGGVLSVSVVDLLAHLLGQGELDGLTGGVRQAGDALLEGLGDNLDLRDGDALLSEVLAEGGEMGLLTQVLMGSGYMTSTVGSTTVRTGTLYQVSWATSLP